MDITQDIDSKVNNQCSLGMESSKVGSGAKVLFVKPLLLLRDISPILLWSPSPNIIVFRINYPICLSYFGHSALGASSTVELEVEQLAGFLNPPDIAGWSSLRFTPTIKRISPAAW